MIKRKQKQIVKYLRMNVYYEEKLYELWHDRFVIINIGKEREYTNAEIDEEINRVLQIICGDIPFRVSHFFKRMD